MKLIRLELKSNELTELKSTIGVLCAGNKTEYDMSGNVSGKYIFKLNPAKRNKGQYYKIGSG